jgi:XisI protein
MDKLKHYSELIQDAMTYYATTRRMINGPNTDFQLIFDTQNHHYQLYRVGWEGLQRVHYCVFHIDIINDKIWVQEDATDYDIVGVLEDEHHIPKSDIVLAFHAPYRRPYTGYAVA